MFSFLDHRRVLCLGFNTRFSHLSWKWILGLLCQAGLDHSTDRRSNICCGKWACVSQTTSIYISNWESRDVMMTLASGTHWVLMHKRGIRMFLRLILYRSVESIQCFWIQSTSVSSFPWPQLLIYRIWVIICWYMSVWRDLWPSVVVRRREHGF